MSARSGDAGVRLVMTLLVRDEIDVIRENVSFHLAHGVDYIVATDNGSTDGTRDFLSDLARDGLATVIDEPRQDYAQSDWVTRMAHIARDRAGADWILHNDADEFWYPASGNLKHGLSEAAFNVLSCPRHNLLPDSASIGRTGFSFLDIVARFSRPFEPDAACLGLRYPSLTTRVGPKVMTRSNGLLRVAQGNHAAAMSDLHVHASRDILIYHFPLRSYEQFERKVVNGGAAYARNEKLPFEVGWHWRRWYEIYQNGRLREEYDRLVLTPDQLQRLVAAGRVEIDDSIQTALRPANIPALGAAV